MLETRITLAFIWVALMLTYLLGDVLRIFSGDYLKMGETQSWGQGTWLGIAMLMVLPILMIVLTIILPQPINRWVNIVVAIFWFGFNLIGLPTYPSAYDKFLLIFSLGLNALTIWYAWKWV